MNDDEQLRELLGLAAELPSSPLSPPTDLLSTARRRQRRLRSRSIVAAAVVLIVAVVVPVTQLRGGASSANRLTASQPLGAHSFIGVVGGSSVDVLSTTDGHVERVLMPAERGRLKVDGLALRGKDLFLTYSTGPECTSDVASCGPKPHSCGAEVDRINLDTNARTVVWTVGDDTLLADARPSPDGTRIAALTSPCVPSYFNQHLVVRDVSSGATVSIGAALPRCHQLGAPAWTGSGNQLLVAYAPATGSVPYTGGDNTCAVPGDTSLVEVDAAADQPGLDGARRAAPPGCSYAAIAARGSEIYAVVGCGPEGAEGPASVQQLTSNLVPQRTLPIGDCTDGNSIAINATGDVLVAAYLYCPGQAPQTTATGPATVLDRIDSAGLTRVSRTLGGNTSPDDIAW